MVREAIGGADASRWRRDVAAAEVRAWRKWKSRVMRYITAEMPDLRDHRREKIKWRDAAER
jgi:hypothetical protein